MTPNQYICFQEEQSTLTLQFVPGNLKVSMTILCNTVSQALFVFNIAEHPFPY